MMALSLEPASRLRLSLLLVALAAAAYVASTPFLAAALRPLLARSPQPPPLALVLLAQGIQMLVVTSLAAFAGGRLALQAGIDAPLLRAIANGTPRPRVPVLTALLWGTLATALVVAALLVARPFVPSVLWKPSSSTSPWIGATSAFYGGIVEEILMRWGLLPAFAWVVARGGIRDPARFWIANIATALLFGAGHLPAVAASGVPLTAAVLAHVLLGNGIAGVVFGWLARRRGLESAMLAHAACDVWLHAALPLVLR